MMLWISSFCPLVYLVLSTDICTKLPYHFQRYEALIWKGYVRKEALWTLFSLMFRSINVQVFPLSLSSFLHIHCNAKMEGSENLNCKIFPFSAMVQGSSFAIVSTMSFFIASISVISFRERWITLFSLPCQLLNISEEKGAKYNL